jgi:hypothetical protein
VALVLGSRRFKMNAAGALLLNLETLAIVVGYQLPGIAGALL